MSSIRTVSELRPAFYAVFDRIAPAANKYMATLFNTSATNIVQVLSVYRLNWQISDVTDADLEQYMARITARTAGTSVAIRSEDTLDAVTAGVLADTDSTGVTETNIRIRFFSSNESPAALLSGDDYDVPAFHSYFVEAGVIYKSNGTKGIILRQNEGISIRNVTASTAGTVSYIIEFTQVYS